MSKEEKKNVSEEETVTDETVTEETPVAEGTSAEEKTKKKNDTKKQKAELEALTKELEEAKAKLAEGDDKYLRLLAEYDNFRRRSKEEKDAVYANAVADTVTELLPLFDNLELATKYTGTGDAAKGVEMILASAPELFAKIGVTAFGEAGDTFDPNIHNAVMHEENEEYGEGVITDVFQKGYRLGDKIIRFAMVKVAN